MAQLGLSVYLGELGCRSLYPLRLDASVTLSLAWMLELNDAVPRMHSAWPRIHVVRTRRLGENAKYAKLHSQNGTSDLPIMRVIARRTLREFWERYPDAKDALDAWYDDAERATWKTPADIRARYPNTSFLEHNRVVFNIRGNHYRLIVQIHYNTQIAFIRFVGTHRDYDRIDAGSV